MASLHKVIVISVLSVSYQMLAQDPADARTDTIPGKMLVELEEVESMGALPAELENAGFKPLLVVTSQDIQSAPATSHEDLLESLPQVDIRQRGRHGVQADLSIQGGSFDQSMVLLNGINLSDPQTGHFQLNLPLDIQAINKIEVATGSATRHYGTNAFSGAVNLVTRPGDSTSFSGGLRMGQYGFYKAGLKANISGDHLSMLATFNTSGSSGYRENTDFKNTSGYIHAIAGRKNLKVHLMTGMSSKAFGANAFYSPKFIHQYEQGNTGMAAVKAVVLKERNKYNFAVYGRFNQDYFLLDRNDPQFYNNNHLSLVSGANAQSRISTKAGISHFGFHFRSEQIKSTSIGGLLEEAETACFNDTVLFTNGHLRTQLNLSVNHTLGFGPFSLSGGFLIHFNSDLAFHPGIYPGIDMRIQLPAHLNLYSSFNRSMRLPTFTDLYYLGPSNVGNPALKPETASLFELGIYRKSSRLQLDMNLFYRQGTNLIDWIWMEDEKWHTMNLTQVDATGLSLSASYRARGPAESWINLTSADASYSFTHLNKVSDPLISRYVLDPLRHKLVLGTGLQIARDFHLFVRCTSQDRKGSYLALDTVSGETTEQAYSPFILMDLKLSYGVGLFKLFIEASNVLDQEYNDIGNVIQPGRWLTAGFEIN